MKNNDWIILNAITYKIHDIENEKNMRSDVIRQLQYLIDFDSASFYVTDVWNEEELTSPVGLNYDEKDMYEYIKQFKKMDYSEGLMYTGKNIAYRESDLVPEEIRVKTDYYKAVYDVQGWHYSLHLNICYKDEFLGILSLFRKKGKPDFKYEDVFILDMIKDHLALRLYRDKCSKKNQKLSIDECVERYALTPRESAVLKELLTDKSADEIADLFNISVSTLRKHCNHIYNKMHINQRIQLYDKIE